VSAPLRRLTGRLLACFVVLWALDVSLERRRDSRRLADSTFHALAGEGAPSLGEVGKMELRLPGSDESWAYVRRPDGWHLPAYREAFALGEPLDGLARALLEGRGTVVGPMPGQAAHFGFEPGRILEARLYDTSDRLLLEARAGATVPGQRSDECYLSVAGGESIFQWSPNAWTYVGTPGNPPFLDPRVIPAALGRHVPLKAVVGGSAAGAVLEIVRKEAPPERLPRDHPLSPLDPFEWYAITAGGTKRLGDRAVYEYLHTIASLTFDGLLGDLRGHEHLFSEPGLTLTLEYDDGAKDTLSLGARDPRGFRWLLNATTGQVFAVREEKAGSLTPDLVALLQR